MDYQARKQYIDRARERYRAVEKKEDKTQIINEVMDNCGYARKHVIRLLRGKVELTNKQAGRRSVYEEDLTPHIRFLWMNLQMISSRRMKAALPTWLEFYKGWKEKPCELSDKQMEKLELMSASTIERFLKKIRGSVKGKSTTRPNLKVKAKIPITNMDQRYEKPGHMQADTVAHCGTRIDGEYAHTVTITDIKTTWTENRAIWKKEAFKVRQTLKDVESFLPFPLIHFMSDCGTEFLNAEVISYLRDRKHPVMMTRSRPYHKDDNCYVEQKNNSHVRELFGYDRFDNRELVELMNDIYKHYWNPLQNFFLPTQKLETKIRIGGRMQKKHDIPKTPYERVLEIENLSELNKRKLESRRENLNPFKLAQGLEKKLKQFFELSKKLSCYPDKRSA